MKPVIAAIAAAFAFAALPALASTGPGAEIYAAQVDPGRFEVESRYDRVDGGDSAGEDLLKLEMGYGLSSQLRVGIQADFERTPGGKRDIDELGLEAIYAFGEIGGVNVALYGEYAVGFAGPDKIEAKMLLQHARGPFDLRINLIGEKELSAGERLALSYAAQTSMAVHERLALGLQALGDLRPSRRENGARRQLAGPVALFELDGAGRELQLQLGYLFAWQRGIERPSGMARLAMELEF